jgi:hypothetical protein
VERLPFDILHHQKVDAVLVADVVKDADVGMVQARDSACLTFEPLAALVIAGEMFGKHFDGNGAVEARVFGAIHFTHAAGSERGYDFVRAKASAGSEGHTLRSCQYTCFTVVGPNCQLELENAALGYR